MHFSSGDGKSSNSRFRSVLTLFPISHARNKKDIEYPDLEMCRYIIYSRTSCIMHFRQLHIQYRFRYYNNNTFAPRAPALVNYRKALSHPHAINKSIHSLRANIFSHLYVSYSRSDKAESRAAQDTGNICFGREK